MTLEKHKRGPLELWGGPECTVNRVGDQYFDQLERGGHATRPEDLDLFASLGLKALRYPVLWVKTAPNGPATADWSWADERLSRLRRLGIRPIVGLVHHGSGPRHTSLADPGFPEGLANYARAVALRYPWVEDYTPVNEVLTTARFSGLYGHWYPHGQDGLTFARALLIQCRAVVLAMRAIREVNPAARLVQTEDLGKTFSTPALAYQADFENERRWVTFDLLCGRVRPGHRMWQYLGWLGIEESELQWFVDNPCPPDVLGINHYLTSERFLDERVHLYPSSFHGGNGRHAYADVEAVRVRAAGLVGPRALLMEVWERYGLPIAVTEAHNGCTREEQIRWFLELWNAAQSAHREGIDVRAVTAWSLLGAYDWNSLLTRWAGHYEPGVFDLRGGSPRPTAIAHILRELAAGNKLDHPMLSVPGWWRRPQRFIFGFSIGASGAVEPVEEHSTPMSDSRPGGAPPILITGADTPLGYAFTRLCELRGLPYHALVQGEWEGDDPLVVGDALDDLKPWAVVNADGYGLLDDAEREPDRWYRENVVAPAALAAACAERNVALLTFSSDLVFDGGQSVPYVEGDAPAPLGEYGRAQAEGEAAVLQAMPHALVIRSSVLFGPWDQANVVTAALRNLADGKSVAAANDVVVSPTYIPDLGNACLDLLIDRESGIWHLANVGAITIADLIGYAADLAGLDARAVRGRPLEALDPTTRRPRYSVLGSERGLLLPSLGDALARYRLECEVDWMADRIEDDGAYTLASGRSACVQLEEAVGA